MGACVSRDAYDNEINLALQQDAMVDKKVAKLLLLGTGESGKSTIFKQMIKLHGKGLTEKDIDAFLMPVRANAFRGIESLIKQSRAFVEEKDQTCAILVENEESAEYIMQFQDLEMEALVTETGGHIAKLWKDPGIQATYDRRGDFKHHFTDNAPYFLDKAEEIFQSEYCVTEEDALKVRVMTTGMTEEAFALGHQNTLLMVDVGGQRSERRKWIRWFDGVDAILFVVAVSEFDQVLIEDCNVNRFEESLRVWEEIVSMETFRDTKFILFLNKIDLLREKVERLKISDYIEEYDGEENDFEHAITYFEARYLDVSDKYDIDVGTYRTTATDSQIMDNILKNVKTVLVKNAMGVVGMM